MIISSINRFCAKHGRITYLFIGVAIIIPFVLFYGDWGGSWQPTSGPSASIGKIFGQSVSRVEFFRQLSAVKIDFYLQHNRYMGTNDQLIRNPEIMQVVSNELLNRLRALHEARRLGIDGVTDEEVKNRIAETPAFQTDGKFDGKKFKEFKDTLLKAENLSAAEFDQIVIENIVIERIEKRVTGGVVASPVEAKIAYMELAAKAEAQFSDFYAHQFLSEVEVTEEEVEAYFNKHLEDKYWVPRQIKIQVVRFDTNDYMDSADITEDEVKQYYDENREKLYERPQMRFRHIFLEVPPEAELELKQEKLERIEEILAELKENNNFADLAMENSDDTTSSRKGGDRGFMDVQSVEVRYGLEFKDTVVNMPLNETSEVIESKRGFHVVEKTDERDVIPFSEVQGQINRILKNRLDDQEARAYYDEHLEDKYAEKQVHARHILIQTNDEDTEETRNAKRQKIEDLLAEAREKNNFYELAVQNSEDESNAKKGGDLGYFGRGKMVKPFEDTAFSMNKGDISDVVETTFGYHIIEKLDERDRIPFAEVKNEITRELSKERRDAAKEAAREDATRFAVAVHTSLQDVPKERKASKFKTFCTEYDQGSKPLVPIESEFFSAADTSVPGVSGYTRNLLTEALKLTRDNPLSEVIESGQSFYVCCWQESRESYVPKFREKTALSAADADEEAAETVLTPHAKTAEKDLKNEKAVAKAREACRKAYEEISAMLAEGKPFQEAIGEIKFTSTGEFPLSQGPRGGSNPEIIKKVAQETKAGVLAAPQEVANGAVLVYIVQHSLPSDDDFASIQSFWMPQFENQKRQLILTNYYKELEARSNTIIFEDWKFVFTPESAEPATTTPSDS